jgi:hypothetical protein
MPTVVAVGVNVASFVGVESEHAVNTIASKPIIVINSLIYG